MTTARATSFATLKDLRGYIKCRDAGGLPNHCLNEGDNGEGAWGDETAQLHTAMVALPSDVAVHNKKVKVILHANQGTNPFVATCNDKSPHGVIDLNPASLVAAGLPSDIELSCPAEWEYI